MCLAMGLKTEKIASLCYIHFALNVLSAAIREEKNALPLADVKRPILSVCITCIFWILGLYNIYAWEL